MAKARKVEAFRDKYFSTVVYEYRGVKYEVTYANGWNVCCTPAWVQHRDKQAEIDDMLDNPAPVADAKPLDWEKEQNDIFEMLGWNE